MTPVDRSWSVAAAADPSDRIELTLWHLLKTFVSHDCGETEFDHRLLRRRSDCSVSGVLGDLGAEVAAKAFFVKLVDEREYRIRLSSVRIYPYI